MPLNPARIPPGVADEAGVAAAVERLNAYQGPGMARMAELAGLT